MRKTILPYLLIALILLSGCSMAKAKYECQVSVRPTGEAPCDFVGGKDHICQLYGQSFDPGSDVPEFCTEQCLERSEFLTANSGWGEAIDPECIKVSIAHSQSEKPELSPEERRINTVELGYEYVEEEVEIEEVKCDPDADESCCVSSGKCWYKGECIDCRHGDCQLDSDCAPVCEGNKLVKRWCNLNTAECEPQAEAFWTDCTEMIDTIGGVDVVRVCKGSGCVVDETQLQSSRDDLRDQYNEYTYARQEVTQLRLKYNRDCLRALSDVTNKLIIDSAMMLKSVPTKMMDLVTDNVQKLIETGVSEMSGDKPKMSTEEYIAYSCNMNKVLTQELKLIDKKQENLLVRIKEIDG